MMPVENACRSTLSRPIPKNSALLLDTAWPVLKAATANVNLVCAAVRELDDVRQTNARLFHFTLGSARHTRRESSVGQQGAVDLPHALLLSQPLEVVIASVMNLQLTDAPPLILYNHISAAELPAVPQYIRTCQYGNIVLIQEPNFKTQSMLSIYQ